MSRLDEILEALNHPTQRERGGPETLEEAVFQALGAASVCWEPMDCTGVFQAERAKEIGGELLSFIYARGPVEMWFAVRSIGVHTRRDTMNSGEFTEPQGQLMLEIFYALADAGLRRDQRADVARIAVATLLASSVRHEVVAEG